MHGKVNKKLVKVIKREKPDAVLYSGDLCDVDTLRDIIFDNWENPDAIRAVIDKKFHRKLVKKAINSMGTPLRFLSSLKIPVFLVYGNNDFLEREVKKIGLAEKGLEKRLGRNIILLKDKTVKKGDIFIAGFPGYRGVQSKRENLGHYEKRIAKLMKKMKHPERVIFLTHDVPYGKFDKVLWKKSPMYGKHVGERQFQKMLKKKTFLVYICSHMHEHQGIDVIGKTPVINTGYGRDGRCCAIDINEGKLTNIRFYR